MSKQIIFNCTPYEIRAAVLDEMKLSDLYIERAGKRSISGNIYKGKVVRILPGMQAAFVDIGLGRAAFLYASDTYLELPDFKSMIPEDKDYFVYNKNVYPIEDLLKEGQEILVQVSKEPLGNKGPRITTYISLPGRKLVLMPTVNHLGISRKIKDDHERERLRKIMENLQQEYNCGLIARTASEGKEERELQNDFTSLVSLWKKIKTKTQHAGTPHLVHEDLNIILQAIRDIYTDEVTKIIIDSEEGYYNVREFMETFMPNAKCALELHEKPDPVFEAYGIESDIGKILNKKIWLKSGGYIILEETEALCAIDVNTGKYVGKSNLEETILKTNLEAIKEIAHQIRIRNIGGIIIIDFIDMENTANRETVFNSLKEAFAQDKHKTSIQRISELGLIEMTRQRFKKSIADILCEPCPYCNGRGMVKSLMTIYHEILRDLEKKLTSTLDSNLCILAHPDVVSFLSGDDELMIDALKNKFHREIRITADSAIPREQYKIIVQ